MGSRYMNVSVGPWVGGGWWIKCMGEIDECQTDKFVMHGGWRVFSLSIIVLVINY